MQWSLTVEALAPACECFDSRAGVHIAAGARCTTTGPSTDSASVCGGVLVCRYAYNWTQPPPGSSFPLVQPIPPSAAAHLVPKHASKGMYSRVETRPGLDTFAANASGLSSALGPLLTWAQAVVPPGAHASTPLFFMGTGGLRRLPAAQQEALLSEVRKQLGQSGFRCVGGSGRAGRSQQRVGRWWQVVRHAACVCWCH